MATEGVYWGRYVGAGLDTSKEKKTPVFCLDFSVTHVLHPGAAEATPLPNPMRATVYKYLSDNAMEYTVEHLESVGFNGDFENPVFERFAESGGAWLYCKVEDYEGKERVKWDFSRKRKREVPERTEIDRAKALYARCKSRIQGSSAGQADAPPPSMPTDDLPF